jgi:septum formation protein
MKQVKSAVLISTSPRRRELLRRLVTSLRIIAPGADEGPVRTPKDLMRNALLKYSSVGPFRADLVIAADTAVFLGKKSLGKPVCSDDAAEMLRRLSGKWHTVVTAMVVMIGGRREKALVTTRVRFRKLDRRIIKAYVESGEPLDKAGAYGIQGQGGLLIEEIAGDYYNVVGLPLPRLQQMLEMRGFSLLK